MNLKERVSVRLEKIKFLIWAKKQAKISPCSEALRIWENSILFSKDINTENLLGDLPHILDKDRQEYWWKFPNYYPFFYGLGKCLMPTSYLEIGTRYGYSLVAIYLGAKNVISQITSIDLQEYKDKSQNYAKANLLAKGYKGQYEFLIGSSHDPKIKEKVKGRLYDLVFVDGDHSYKGAMEDIVFYWNNVTPGGFMIIDDVLWQIFSLGKKVLRAIKDSLPKLNNIEFTEFIGAGVRPKHRPEYGVTLEDFKDFRTNLTAFYRGLFFIKKQPNK